MRRALIAALPALPVLPVLLVLLALAASKALSRRPRSRATRPPLCLSRLSSRLAG